MESPTIKGTLMGTTRTQKMCLWCKKEGKCIQSIFEINYQRKQFSCGGIVQRRDLILLGDNGVNNKGEIFIYYQWSFDKK